jgi:hypothetical protein
MVTSVGVLLYRIKLRIAFELKFGPCFAAASKVFTHLEV